MQTKFKINTQQRYKKTAKLSIRSVKITIKNRI